MMRDGRGHQSPSGPPEEKHPNLGKNDHVFSAKANYSYDTHGLVAAYHRAALSHGIVGGVQAPEGQHEKQCINELKKAFSQAISYNLAQLAESGRFPANTIENYVGPHRRFFHDDLVTYQSTHLPAEISFLAEMHNKQHESVNLSPFGWIKHSKGPVFSRVHSLLHDPSRYKIELLYSKAAFQEELEMISREPMRCALGFVRRSFILESALHQIAQASLNNKEYHSSVSHLTVSHTSGSEAEIAASLQRTGAMRIRVLHDQETATIRFQYP